MRNYSKTIGALAAASTLVAGNALAETESTSAEIEGKIRNSVGAAAPAAPTTTTYAPVTSGLAGEVTVGYSNMYEFRFFDVGDSLFEAGVDLSYEAGPVTLTGGAWYGGWDNRNAAPLAAPNSELDLYAGIGTELGPVSLEVGYIYYMFPSFAAINTQEVYLSAGVDLFWGIGLSSTAFYDFDLFNGIYVDTSISKSFEFTDSFGLDLAAGWGYADGHGLQGPSNPLQGGTKDGSQGFYVAAQLPWEFRDGVTLTPYVKYTDGDGGLATGPNAIDNGQDFVIAGVKLGVTF